MSSPMTEHRAGVQPQIARRTDISAAEVDSARLETDLQLPIHLKQLFSETKAGRAGKIGGREVCTISGLNGGELVAVLLFR